MTISFGTGQTNGIPLLLTAILIGSAQTVHTFPAGAATPNLLNLFCTNTDTVGRTLNLALYDSTAVLVWSASIVIGAKAVLEPVFDAGSVEADLIANGTCVLKAFADTASVLSLSATVDNQSSTTGTVAQNFGSGLVAAVQNSSRYAFPAAQAGVGVATEANANQMIARAGILRNLKAKADTTVGGGATVTVAVRVNGASSALSVTIAAAQTTVIQSDTDSVAVAIGDLVTFLVSCDNAGAPAANFQAACEYVAA